MKKEDSQVELITSSSNNLFPVESGGKRKGTNREGRNEWGFMKQVHGRVQSSFHSLLLFLRSVTEYIPVYPHVLTPVNVTFSSFSQLSRTKRSLLLHSSLLHLLVFLLSSPSLLFSHSLPFHLISDSLLCLKTLSLNLFPYQHLYSSLILNSAFSVFFANHIFIIPSQFYNITH